MLCEGRVQQCAGLGRHSAEAAAGAAPQTRRHAGRTAVQQLGPPTRLYPNGGSTKRLGPPRPTCQPPGTPAAVAAQLGAGATAAAATAAAAQKHRARRAVLERAMTEPMEGQEGRPASKEWRSAGGQQRRRERQGGEQRRW